MSQPLPSEREIKRFPDIAVGDLIQYRYSYGFASSALTTRTVIEVIDGGAGFVVEGFFNVPAGCVTHHIPMHASKQQSAGGWR